MVGLDLVILTLQRLFNWQIIRSHIMGVLRQAAVGLLLISLSMVFVAFALGFAGYAGYTALSETLDPVHAAVIVAAVFFVLAAIAAFSIGHVLKSGLSAPVRTPTRSVSTLPSALPVLETASALVASASSAISRKAPSLTMISLLAGFIVGVGLFTRHNARVQEERISKGKR